jgi:uncharacterized protein YjbI with pentapeptide repeats
MHKEPEHEEDPYFDDWLNRHVERWLPTEKLARLDAYIAGDGEGGDHCETPTIRRELREAYRHITQLPLPEEIRAAFGELHALRDLRPAPDEHVRADLIKKWNQLWARHTGPQRRSLPPSMSGYSLSALELPGIDLTNADLHYRSSIPAIHGSVDLRLATLIGANFSGCSLPRANLEKADLTYASLVGADLRAASLAGAGLVNADLRDALLEEADMTGADLTGANLEGAEMRKATLDAANLSNSSGLLLDSNSVFRTRFTNQGGVIWRLLRYAYFSLESINIKLGFMNELDRTPIRPAEDLWSSFRRLYTGPNFFISLLFLVAFLAPYLVKAVLLAEVSRAQGVAASVVGGPDRILQAFQQIDQALTTASENVELLLAPTAGAPPAANDVQAVLGTSVLASLGLIKQMVSDLHTNIQATIAGMTEGKQYEIWEMLLGFDTGNWFWSILIGLLLLYNAIRWFLTVTIAPMRDAEDRSYISPARAEYLPLRPLHRGTEILYWLSICTAGVTFYQWMRLPVLKFW